MSETPKDPVERAGWVPSPGIHPDIESADYHADRLAVSSSNLKRMLRSPAHFIAALDEAPRTSRAMSFGTAMHCMLLEPDKFPREYAVVIPSVGRTSARKHAPAVIEGAAAGGVTISETDHSEMLAMAVAANRHAAIRAMLDHGQAETTFCWIDVETGVMLKVRPDWFQLDECIWDVKTAEDGSAKGFSRACAQYEYHLSCAMYRCGVHALTGKWLPFRFVVLEKGLPYAVAVYEADTSFIRRGERDFRSALHRLAQCRSSGEWPGYQQNEIEPIGLPPWK